MLRAGGVVTTYSLDRRGVTRGKDFGRGLMRPSLGLRSMVGYFPLKAKKIRRLKIGLLAFGVGLLAFIPLIAYYLLMFFCREDDEAKTRS